MRPTLLLVPVLATACLTPVGQRVNVLLNDVEVACEPVEGEEGTFIGTFELSQTDDFYQVQFQEADGRIRTLSGLRDGREVTFVCPKGEPRLIVRHATILEARAQGDPVAQ